MSVHVVPITLLTAPGTREPSFGSLLKVCSFWVLGTFPFKSFKGKREGGYNVGL